MPQWHTPKAELKREIIYSLNESNKYDGAHIKWTTQQHFMKQHPLVIRHYERLTVHINC